MKETSRRPSLEYALIEGINDDAASLASLLAFCKVPAPGFHVNLIPLNTTEDSPKTLAAFRGSSPKVFSRFLRDLKAAGISASARVSKGDTIAAACGQLSSKK